MSQYRIPFRVDFHADAGAVTPLRMAVDFSRFLPKGRLVDPHTLKAVRKFSDGAVREYPLGFSEKLYYGNQGHITLAVEEPRKSGQWELFFRARKENGALAPFPDYVPPVGVGDELLLNSGRWAPMRIPGMHPFPMAVDWTGDGRTDVLSTSHYSNVQGMPWAGVFLFRNIGSDAEARFSAPLRIYAEGVDEVSHHMPGVRPAFPARRDFISEYYIRADCFPWFKEGGMDLLTASAQSPYIKVYRNTGQRDAAGLPELELALKEVHDAFGGGNLGFRVVDWDGDGRPSIVVGQGYRGADEGILLLRNFSDDPFHPDFRAIPMLQGCLDRNFNGSAPFSFDLYDLDGDGELELIVSHLLPPAGPVMKVFKNGGTPDKPRWYDIGNTAWFSHHTGFGFRFVDTPAFHGALIGSVNGSWGIRYYERNLTQSDPLAKDAFIDRGPLLGEGVKLSGQGYVAPFPCDPAGDGNIHFVLGDEPCFVTFAENVGTREAPRWNIPKFVNAGGAPIHLYREGILHDHDGEMWCGQVKPQIVDWDGDGIPDLIAGNNTNKIFFFRGLGNMVFDPPEEIEVGGEPFPFGWRKAPFAIDWNGDGLRDLVAVDKDERVCLFRRKEKDGKLILLPGEVFRYEDGEAVTTNSIPPGIYRNPIVCLWVCDWNGDGDWDLLASSNRQTSLLENVGTNEQPLFKRPVPLSTPDGEINICHHESRVTALDWDLDGDLDVVIGGESGTLYFFRRDWLERREHGYEIG
jgi:hypothetical protein